MGTADSYNAFLLVPARRLRPLEGERRGCEAPMEPRFRKQVLLFLAVVLVPSLMLTAVGIGLLFQEDALESARLRERRQSAARELSLRLAEQLESPPADAVVAVLAWRRDKILLPWELDRERSAEELAAASSDFRRAVSRGEALEFPKGDHNGAAEAYARALELAERPAPQALARLHLARAVMSGGRTEAAAGHVAELLRTPLAITDEYGVPFAVFGVAQAEQLAQVLGASWSADLKTLLAGRPLLAPATLRTIASYRLERPTLVSREAVEEDANASAGLVDSLLVRSSRLEALVGEFGNLIATAGLTGEDADAAPWIAAQGEPLWLVGFARQTDQRSVTVVQADRVMAGAGLTAPESTLTTRRSDEGIALGARFPGVFVQLSRSFDAEVIADSRRRRLLYSGALFVIVSATSLGAWFVFRDIRRDAMLIEMRSRFVASVSHELKTPLTAVRMFAEMLRRDLAPAKHARYVETILAESERLSRLLDNVLDFSKIERGEKQYALKTIRLQVPMRRAEATLKPQLERQGYSLRTAIDEAVPAVVADADAIEQAVVNLISNAVKYSDGHRGVDLSLWRHDREAVISVRDRGIGIDQKDRARIFDEFFRGSSVDRLQIPGTGLGLTIVAHIARAHGGRIDVESAPGEGSTFSLCVPFPDDEARPGGSPS